MADKPIHFMSHGKRWGLERPDRLPNDRWGDCDPPTAKNKKIRIRKSAKDDDELYYIIHEFRHTENFGMYDEDYVVTSAEDLTRLLWRLGYRKVENINAEKKD